MGGKRRPPWPDRRAVIIGCAVACYGTALVIAAVAARLPDSRAAAGAPAASDTTEAAARAGLAAPLPPAPPIGDEREIVTEPPTLPPAAPVTGSWEQDLFSLAREQRQSGDFKGAEENYLRLLRQGGRRDEAARKLGELYLRAGDYGRAEAMFLESARILKARQD